MIKTLYWTDDGVVMIDQRRLPTEELYPLFRTHEEVAQAIKEMVVRGAPAIGVAAAMGIALGARNITVDEMDAFDREFDQICELMASTRPTAVNLFWAMSECAAYTAISTEGKACLRSEVDHKPTTCSMKILLSTEGWAHTAPSSSRTAPPC
jgi:methylthioribose-1-phosphate isomerase